MAHPYTTDEQISNHMGADLRLALQALDDTVDVQDVLAGAREDAESYIDGKLAQRYEVPFAAITDTPATPTLVQKIAKDLTAYELLRKRHPEVAKSYLEEADGILAELRSGEAEIPDAARVTADSGLVGFAAPATEPAFAGLDDDGDDRMDAW